MVEKTLTTEFSIEVSPDSAPGWAVGLVEAVGAGEIAGRLLADSGAARRMEMTDKRIAEIRVERWKELTWVCMRGD